MAQATLTESEEAELDAWLATLPRKMRFMLGMAASALSLQHGQCRTRNEILGFINAAGLPLTRQSIEITEKRALRKCRRKGLALLAKEHLTLK